MRTSHFVAFILLGAALLIPFSTTTIAQRPGPKQNQDGNPRHASLPSWFRDLDENGEGQVTLWQWRNAGLPLDAFRKFDLNGDGIITTDELLRFLKRPFELKLTHGRGTYTGTVEEAEELCRGRKSFRVFTVRLEQGKTYQIDLKSAAFQSMLFLEDADENLLAENNSPTIGGNARIVFRADRSGTHRLIVTSVGGYKIGDFLLSVRLGVLANALPSWFRELDEEGDGQVTFWQWRNAGRPLDEFSKYDLNGDGIITTDELLHYLRRPVELRLDKGRATYNGTVEEAEETYRDKKSFKILTIKLEQGKTYQIDLHSGAFQAFLFLEDADGNLLEENGSPGGGGNARIDFRADRSGTYRLIATSVGGFRTGNFLLSVRLGVLPEGLPAWFRDLDEDGDGQVTLWQWRNAGRSLGEFRKYDLNSDGIITTDEILHALKKPVKPQPDNVPPSVQPNSLPSWFKALDKHGDGQVTLRQWRNAGKSLDDFRKYDLNADGIITTDELLRYLRRPVVLKLDNGRATYHGTVEEAGEVYRDKKSFKVVTVMLEQGKTYEFDLKSGAFQAFLYLEDADGNLLEQNGSRTLSGNARIVFRAEESGPHRLIATSAAGVRTGDFLLSVHLGVLASGLPAWFRELDEDGDGQVTLWQWRNAGKSLDEFRKYDLNSDGIITTDEILHALKKPVEVKLDNGHATYNGTAEEAEEVYRDKKSFKILTIKVEQGKTYQIDLTSAAFQALLYLEDADGNLLVEDSSSDIGGHARIVVVAEKAATLRLIATSVGGYKTGKFIISVRPGAQQ